MISNRIRNELKNDDIIIRYGGDEFIVVLNKISDDKAIMKVCKRIYDTVLKSMVIDNIVLNPILDIGYSKYPYDSKDVRELIQFADAAMYESKKTKNKVVKFDRYIYDNEIYIKNMEFTINSTLKNNGFYIEYQNIDNLEDKSNLGIEAYVRVKNEKIQEVLSVAKESDLIIEIDKLVVAKVVSDLKDLNGTVFLNIAMKSLFSEDYFNHLKKIINKNNIEPSSLCLDIAEKIIINNKNALSRISKFKTLGLKIAIDDYGLGHLSFKDISYGDYDIVKIDTSFTRDIFNNSNNQKIAEIIIELSNIFGKSVIAEGIEDLESYEFLKSIGCSYGQGNYIQKPNVIQKIEDMECSTTEETI